MHVFVADRNVSKQNHQKHLLESLYVITNFLENSTETPELKKAKETERKTLTPSRLVRSREQGLWKPWWLEGNGTEIQKVDVNLTNTDYPVVRLSGEKEIEVTVVEIYYT